MCKDFVIMCEDYMYNNYTEFVIIYSALKVNQSNTGNYRVLCGIFIIVYLSRGD